MHRELRWVRTLLTVAAFAGAASAQVTHFGLTAPANPQAGVPFSLGITALDKNTQAVTNYTGTISLEIGGVFTAPPLFTFTPGDQGALNVPVTLRIAGKVSMVVTDTVSGVGGNITVDVLPTHLRVSAPASATAGVPFPVSVVALDQNDNPLPAFSDLIGFVTQDPGATVPAPLLINGSGTYGITAGAAGNRRLDVTDIASGFTIFGSAQYTVSAAGASHFRVTTPPTVLPGAMFNFQVTALDAFNNLDTSFSGMVQFSSGDAAASLPPDTALVNGQGSFGATLNTAGNESLVASSAGITGSARVAVPGPATHLRLAAPAHTYPGSAFHVAVEALDAAGNLVTNYAGTIHFSSSDAAAAQPADFAFASSDKGMHSFGNGVILNTGGIQSLTVTQIASAISGGASVRVGPKAGCFQPGVSLSEGRHPSAVAAADFDLDSKQDIAIADQGTDVVSATVTYLGGNGDGSFRLPKTYAAAPDLFDIVAADLNGDAKPDLVTGGFGAPYLPKTLTVLLGNGDGTFQPHTD